MTALSSRTLFRAVLPAALLAVATSPLAAGAATPPAMSSVAAPAAVPPRTPSPEATPEGDGPKQDPNAIVMTVNGTAIKRSEVDRIISLILASNPDKHKPSSEMKTKGEIAARQKLVEMVILYDAGVKEPPADLDKQVTERMAERKKQFASGASYQEALSSTGMTDADLQEFTRKEVIISNFVKKEFISKVAVSDDDARAFYDRNHEKFKKVEETRRVSHILIGFDTTRVTPEQKKEYREKAEAIRARLAAGESFEEIARKESTCPSGRNGGDLSFIGKGQMVPAFEKSAYELKKGEISQVVESRQGYHIIKLVDIKEAEYVPFAEAREKIKEFIRIEEGKKKLDVYLAGEKARATITMASAQGVPNPAKSPAP